MSTTSSLTTPTTVATGQRSAGSGRGRNRSSGRGGGRGGGQSTATSSTRARGPTFRGTTAEMNGHVFQTSEEQPNRVQFKKTMEALEAYAKTKLTFAEDLATLFALNMGVPDVAMPVDIGPDATVTTKMIHQERVKQWVRRSDTLVVNLANIHSVVWGQCSEAMKTRVRTLSDYQAKADANDCHWLLQRIRGVTMELQERRHHTSSSVDARLNFLSSKQQPSQTIAEFKATVKNWADAIHFHGGTVAENVHDVPEFDENGIQRTTQQREDIATEITMATVLINGADPSKYGSLVADLCNQFVKGKDEYPQTLADAVSMLELYTPLTNHSHGSRSGASGGSVQSAQSRGASAPEPSATTFVQQGNGAMSYQQRVAASVAGTDGVLHAGISCFGCGGYGHYSDMCTGAPNNTPTTTGTTLTQYAFMLAQSCDMGIDPDSILLDSQSTISVFRNPRMLTNIRRSKHTLRAITNGGYQDSNLVGDFANLGEVWFNENSIANILSLADECNVCRVTMDSGIERSMNVHRLDGSIMQFVEHESGLYVYHPNVTNPPVTGYSMLSTVAAQKKLFTPRQIRDADTARNLYRMIGRPSAAEFQTILRRGYIRNCPVTPADARRADIIYGPDIATIKGKCKRREAAARVPTFEAVPIPPPVLAHHLDITLCLDFFFVQGLGFYHSISRNVGFRTVKPIADRTKGAIVSSAKADIALYAARGFHVRDAHADHEFECARDALRPVVLNIVPPDSHVGEVERSIQTIKERLRSCVHGLPFKRLPKLMIRCRRCPLSKPVSLALRRLR